VIVIHLGRKPLIGSVAKNVLQYGTGGLNIDASRIGKDIVGWGGEGRKGGTWDESSCGLKEGEARPVAGRWPANLVMEHSTGCTSLADESGKLIWVCVKGCPLTHLVIQGGSEDFFLQVQSAPVVS